MTVRGNWDVNILIQNDAQAQWYQAQLGAARLDYLRQLPYVHDFWLSGQRIRLYHASEDSVHTRRHMNQSDTLRQQMFQNTDFTGSEGPEPDIVGYGDIHAAYMLARNQRVLFNAGSVGNPLDLSLATYAILSGTLDSQTAAPFSIDFVRLPYDIEAEIAAAQQLDAPQHEAYAVELRTAVYRGRQ